MDDLSQLRRGAVELAVLLLLADGELYGGALVDALAQYRFLVTGRGTVYPMLSRLRSAGLVETTWHESPVGPPRRYYRLTAQGTGRPASGAAMPGAGWSPTSARS